MRADRLIALLLLLQRKGRITAAEAAEELEVSPRTARRDLEALAMSGVPVYSRHGRGGGWELIGGAQTDLTGLSADEARAMFLAAGPVVEESPELKSAIRKLSAALPATFQAEAEAAASAVKVDPSGWGQVRGRRQPRHLDVLIDAVVSGKQIEMDYKSQQSPARVRTVHPLGLVTKRNVWYLVAATENGETRTYRVGRVSGVTVLDQDVVRPVDFDLDESWDRIVTQVEQKRETSTIRAAVDPTLLGPLRWVFGTLLTSVDDHPSQPGSHTNWPVVTIEVRGEDGFAGQIAGFGAGVELLDAPPGVAERLRNIGRQLTDLYGP
jgi:predicted DNA-binding transcriptional regulator YafY